MARRIEDYGLIGDLQTAALVGRDGSIDWLCLPRFDSPACFAALLDEERAGRWLLAPAGAGSATRRRYRGDSLVLESEWELPEGTVRFVSRKASAQTRTYRVEINIDNPNGAIPDRPARDSSLSPLNTEHG